VSRFGEFRLMLLVIGRGAVLVEWYRCSCRMLLFCKVYQRRLFVLLYWLSHPLTVGNVRWLSHPLTVGDVQWLSHPLIAGDVRWLSHPYCWRRPLA